MRLLSLFVPPLLVATTLAAQEVPPLDLESITVWAGRGDSIHGERGLLEVPLVRSDPGGRTIQVEIHRFRALGGAGSGAPPVVLLHGGPGWPGLGGCLSNERCVRREIERYVKVTDLVVIGQRGIGSSPPNTECNPVEGWPRDVSASLDIDAMADLIRRSSIACRAHWQDLGYDLSGFNVVEAAADVNDARRALGYDRVTIWGVSFGSHWGMAVLRYHPDIVARAVLSGMEGPDHTYDSPSGVLNALERIAEAAERSPSLAQLIPEGGLVAGLRETIHSLDRVPVTTEIARRGTPIDLSISGADVRNSALGYTARASSRQGMRSWPADVIRLVRGDWEGLANSLARDRGAPSGMPTASFWMLDCGSGITPERRARYAADPAQDVVGDPGAFYDAGCPHWGSDLGDGFRQNFGTDIPTLIVQGEWDTSTPMENALELAPYFRNSTFVRVEGGSHGALNEVMGQLPELSASIMRFVATGDLGGFPERVSLPELDWIVPEIH